MKKIVFTKLSKSLILVGILLFTLVQCGKSSPSVSETAFTGNSKAITLTQVSSFGTNPGALAMYKYVPAGLPANAPLVVALHGCTQDAATYAKDTEWSKLADEFKFAVVFPQQSSSNNSSKCFNWFESGDIARGAGEALSVKQMVDQMKTDHAIDATRVFVTGLSAGAYFTVVMAAAYPDVFAGAAPMAGGPYKCATSMTNAFSCMSPGTDKTGSAWATLIKGAYSGYTGKYPTMSIWAGTSDSTVKPMNAVEIMQGWASVLGIDETADGTDTIQGNVHKVYKDANGKALIETWDLASMGHGISVDPDGTNGKSGGATNSYAFDKNVWSSYEVLKFWGLDNTDKVAPTVSISGPSAGATVSGNISISAAASDNVGVTKVEIYVDSTLKTTLTASPYTYTWNTAQEYNGTHNVIVKAYDAAGNIGTTTLSVTVTGGLTDTTAPVITADKDSGTYATSVTVTLSANEPATIYYTTDGSAPTQSSSIYSAALTFSSNTTLKFFGKDSSNNVSSIVTKTYAIDILTYTETLPGTATEHYVAGRLDATGYTKYGTEYGYTASFALYHLKAEYGGTWVDIHDLPGGGGSTSDTVAPTVSISSPSNGATLSGSVTVSAAASDNVGVTKVEFYIDGTLKATVIASPYSYAWSTTDYSNASHTILVKAYDAAGNIGTSSTISVTVNNAGGATFINATGISGDDGYVKALSGGSSPATVTYGNLAIGRGTDSKFNRAILSFDTSAIPDNATITKAYVTVTYASGSGSPWASSNSLVIDVKNGTFGAATMETSDWAAAATADAVASLASFTSGTKQSSDFSASGLSAINKTGKTQLKLRFLNNQTSTAYIFIKEGASATLHVEYQ